jgi:hypothetical protein
MMPITNANATATVATTNNAKTGSESLEFLTKVDQFLATCAEKPLPAHSDDLEALFRAVAVETGLNIPDMKKIKGRENRMAATEFTLYLDGIDRTFNGWGDTGQFLGELSMVQVAVQEEDLAAILYLHIEVEGNETEWSLQSFEWLLRDGDEWLIGNDDYEEDWGHPISKNSLLRWLATVASKDDQKVAAAIQYHIRQQQ